MCLELRNLLLFFFLCGKILLKILNGKFFYVYFLKINIFLIKDSNFDRMYFLMLYLFFVFWIKYLK